MPRLTTRVENIVDQLGKLGVAEAKTLLSEVINAMTNADVVEVLRREHSIITRTIMEDA